MINRLLLNIIGYFIAVLPARWIGFLCQILGQFLFLFFRRRRHIILSNLAHAFPNKTQIDCTILGQKSCTRMIELGLLAVALPYFSKRRIRQSFQVDPSIEEFFREKEKSDGPRIVLLPHFSQMEAMTIFPLLNEKVNKNEIGVIYRPFKNKALERWMRKTREKFGLKLLARGTGFFGAKEILKRSGIVVILFDQNASDWGVLSTFFGRISSTTSLPDLLFKHFHCPIYMLMPKRLGIFSAKCYAERLNCDSKNQNKTEDIDDYCVANAMNIWLEKKLSSDDDICCDWLWAHNRWHTHDQKNNWLNLSQKRCAIDFSRIEKKVKIFVRMPNWLGDVIMSIPLIKAVRKARPDAEIILIIQMRFVSFLEKFSLADRILPIEKKENHKLIYLQKYYRQLLEYRHLKPDFMIRLNTNSITGDIETLLLNSSHAFAYQLLPSKKRPWFSECIVCDNSTIHQVENLLFFVEKMGYKGDWDLKPMSSKIEKLNRIGVICGSENNPQKRWPTQYWIDLIKFFLSQTTSDIILFGTSNDTDITGEIKKKFSNEDCVIDRAGKTDMLEFSNEIATCKFVIGNDTGGVHLSNFLGIPTVVLFGPTNPNRTRPIFDAPVEIIKSPDQKNFAKLEPNDVIELLSNFSLFS